MDRDRAHRGRHGAPGIRGEPQPDSWQRMDGQFRGPPPSRTRRLRQRADAVRRGPARGVAGAEREADGGVRRRGDGRGGAVAYWMISSARASSDGDMVRPSALAVFKSVTYCSVLTID